MRPKTGSRIFAARLGLSLAISAIAMAGAAAQAQTEPTEAGPPRPSAPWLTHLTLGPGDILNLGVFDQPELAQNGVVIGPDGRIGYLEAQDVIAAGLTIDELRQRLDSELGRYRRSPRTIVTPVEFRSKKYYVLGMIANRGVYTLDRPITLIEAVARAHGLSAGLSSGGATVEYADLSHSFLARNGQRLTVDFEKLFLQGDLSQNVWIEPGDYLYFPSAQSKGIYVLGAVTQPGGVPFTSDLTAVSAIASRGGFTPQAWRMKVLVVRGSLNQPQLFVVNAADVLTARAADIPLQPGDIVFVHTRPWVRGEELLDLAASSFVQTATIIWSSNKLFPSLNVQ